MKKILFVSTAMPTTLGGIRSLYYNMLAFSKEFEVHFIRVKTGEESGSVLPLPEFVKFSQVEAGRCLDPIALVMAAHAGTVMKIESVLGTVQEYVERHKISVVVTHAMDVSFALRKLRAPVKVAYQIDSFARYYRSKMRASTTPATVALRALQVPLYSIIEHSLFDNFDLIAYVSSMDIGAGNRKKTLVISQGRDPPAEGPGSVHRTIDVAILGRWEHPPNRDGMAKVICSLGEINGRVLIIGPGLDVRGLPKNVEYAGMVPDVGAYLRKTKICLVPVWYGAGLQTKVFDALRHGCKVVTTRFTKEAFNADGFESRGIMQSEDLIAMVNAELGRYDKLSAGRAYRAYRKFYRMNSKAEKEFVGLVAKLVKKAGYSRP